jgi:hypothetical protein
MSVFRKKIKPIPCCLVPFEFVPPNSSHSLKQLHQYLVLHVHISLFLVKIDVDLFPIIILIMKIYFGCPCQIYVDHHNFYLLSDW